MAYHWTHVEEGKVTDTLTGATSPSPHSIVGWGAGRLNTVVMFFVINTMPELMAMLGWLMVHTSNLFVHILLLSVTSIAFLYPWPLPLFTEPIHFHDECQLL